MPTHKDDDKPTIMSLSSETTNYRRNWVRKAISTAKRLIGHDPKSPPLPTKSLPDIAAARRAPKKVTASLSQPSHPLAVEFVPADKTEVDSDVNPGGDPYNSLPDDPDQV